MNVARATPWPAQWSAALLLLFTLAASALGQIRPEAPVRNFLLPRFGEDGYKIWDLRGSKGTYLDAARIRVEGMKLRVFSGGAARRLETSIESPEALIHIEENRAEGRGTLFITGPNYRLAGEDWEWNGDAGRIRVHSRVRVVFDQAQLRILE